MLDASLSMKCFVVLRRPFIT